MTEITRVPLPPIAKGSLGKLWLGVAAVMLAAGGLAWASLPHGVAVDVVKAGSGTAPTDDDVVFAKYTGKLANGTVFDMSQDAQVPIKGLFPPGSPLPLANMIPGMREGLKKTQKGGRYVIAIPAAKAYGATPPQGAPIPPNADLVFDVEVLDIMPRADFDRRVEMLQQMMQMQQMQGGRGGRGGPPPGAMPPRN